MRRIDEGLWVFDRPFSAGPLALGTRMTAIRLSDGGLFLHSPVELDARTREGLASLGPVRCVVAPNRVHHLFVGPYRDAFPEARLYAAPGLPSKRRDLRFDEELGPEAPAVWSGQIDQHLFLGAPVLNEVAFLHRATRTLILTDLAFNVTESDSLATRLWLRATGCYGRFSCSRLLRLLLRDRDAARHSLERILSWDFERVVVTHGIVLQRAGKRLLRESYGWLLGSSPPASTP